MDGLYLLQQMRMLLLILLLPLLFNVAMESHTPCDKVPRASYKSIVSYKRRVSHIEMGNGEDEDLTCTKVDIMKEMVTTPPWLYSICPNPLNPSYLIGHDTMWIWCLNEAEAVSTDLVNTTPTWLVYS